ncbi:hypothetical protein PQX77_012813, partial [Marasmius sp. AFHP31]
IEVRPWYPGGEDVVGRSFEVEGHAAEGGVPVSFRDIGVPEAEGILRRAHNLPSGASLSLGGLSEPAVDQRPPHTYNMLVQLAIWESPERRLTLHDIYAAISNRFGFYRGTSGEIKRRWRRTIRHMLNRDAFFRIRDTDQIGLVDHWEINFARLGRQQRRKVPNVPKPRGQQQTPTMEGFEDVRQGLSFEELHHADSSLPVAAPSTSIWTNEALSSTASPRLSALRPLSSLSRNASPALPGEISGPVFLHPPSAQFPVSVVASGGWPVLRNTSLASQAFDATLGDSSSFMRRPPTFFPLSGALNDPSSFYDLPSPAMDPSSHSFLSSEPEQEEPVSSRALNSV